MKQRRIIVLSRSISLFLALLFTSGCATNQSALQPGLVPSAKSVSLAGKVYLQVDPGNYGEGTAIGEGGGERLNLGQSIQKIIENDPLACANTTMSGR